MVELSENPNAYWHQYGEQQTLETLKKHTPESAGIQVTATHRPVPFSELLEKTYHALDLEGFTWKEPTIIAHGKKDPVDKDVTLFTRFKARIPVTHPNLAPVIGRRDLPAMRTVDLSASYDKHSAAQLSFGLVMMVCSNGMVIFNPEFVSKRKQTPGLEKDQYGMIFGGVACALLQYGYQDTRVAEMEAVEVSDDQMILAAHYMIERGVIKAAMGHKVVEEYRKGISDDATPEQESYRDRNLWSAANAVTSLNQGHLSTRGNPFGQAKRDHHTVRILEHIVSPTPNQNIMEKTWK